MRLLRWIAATVVLAPLPPLSTPATAQQPLRITRHAPTDTARSGDVIAISFDRPVATSIDRAPDPTRFVRVEPTLPATIQWRDLVTIRIIPDQPLPPSARFTVIVRNTFAAEDGGRLAGPYQFTLHTFGPRLLARLPRMSAGGTELFEPNGKVTLIYSAPVDTAELSRVTRLEIASSANCVRHTIHFRVKAQRLASVTEQQLAIGPATTNLDARFHTAVQLGSDSALPDGCTGTWVIPSFDPGDNPEIRYRAATMLPFQIAKLECTDPDCAITPALRIRFTAPVQREVLMRRLSIEPRIPFGIDEQLSTGYEWVIRVSVRMHTTYRVRLDPLLRDTYGRTLDGARDVSLAIGDRRPALGHQLGFFTLSRQHPVLRLAYINVDSVDLAIVPVPDSLRAAVVLASDRPDSVGRIIGRLRDTVHEVTPLARRPNEEQFTDIAIPRAVMTRYPGALLAIRAGAIWYPTPITPDSGKRQPGELPTILISGTPYELSRQVALVQITDLVTHAKVDESWGSVFVTNINDGRAIAGAGATLRDRDGNVSATGVTDAAGVADLRRDPQWHEPAHSSEPTDYWYPGIGDYRTEARLVEVVRGTDRAMMLISPYGEQSQVMEMAYPDRSYDRSRFLRAMAYTERPIYRPAEKAFVGIIVRQGWLGDLTVPRGDSVRLRIVSAAYGPNEAETVRDTVLRLTDFGSTVDSFTIPRAATLGEYTVRVDAVVDSAWQTLAWTGLNVAEYRAPEFRASVTLDSAIRFLGDTIHGRVSGQYYFGAAMAGAEVNWSASTSDARGPIPIASLPNGFIIGYRFSDGPDHRSSGEQMSGVDTLDATGAVRLAIPTTAGTLNGPGQLEVQVAVADMNRQVVTASASAPVHASAFYVAVRDTSRAWYWQQDVPRSFDVMTIRPDGQRVSGVRVGIVVVRHQYVWSTTSDGSSGTGSWVSDTIMRDSLVTSESFARFRYTPRSPGSHQLSFTIHDDHGRRLTTSIGRYVMSSGANFAWGQPRAALSMRLTPDTAAVGDTVRVQFISPFDRAEAWVTVEREGILGQRRLTVRRGETTVPFEVSERFLPGATVAVLLVDSTAAWLTDSLHQRLRTGRIAFHVVPSPKRLNVEIAAGKDRYEPGDSARVAVRLRDHLMRPVLGEVTLWAVDESVLALADYETPDPYAVMYAERSSGLMFSSMATSLAQLYPSLRPSGWLKIRGAMSLSSVVMTGTASERVMSARLRSNFRTTAFFLANLPTDTTGAAKATVKLPDNLTTYRLIAVGGTADSRFGGAVATLLVTKPLLARTALPRFVRTGDQLLAGAVLTNRTGKRASVGVRASGKSVSLDGDDRLSRLLGADSSAEVRFGWRTTATLTDSASFRFDIDGGGYGDAVQMSVPVRAPYSPRFHTMTGIARGTSIIRMYLPPEMDPARSRLTLRVGTTPVPVIRSNYWRMHVYPYQCTEQLSSAGQVAVAMLRLQRAGLIDSTIAPRSADLRRDLQIVVDELARRQSAEGGIGYWGRTDWTTPRLTTYAGAVLLAAREMGADVRERTLTGITSYLSETRIDDIDSVYRTREERRRMIAVNLAERVARLRYLRQAGAPDTAGENGFAGKEPQMSWEDRVLLAELLAAGGDSAGGRAVLARAWARVEAAGRRLDVPDSLLPSTWFPSRVRPIARLLRATLALDPTNPGIPLAIETVVHQERAERGSIWNTHDYAAASAALSDIAIWQRTTESSGSIEVRSAERHHTDQVLMRGLAGAGRDSTISLAGLVERAGGWFALPLRVEGGDRALFYSLTVEEIPVSLPTTPDAKGFVVERWFERFDNGRPATEVREGELVRGRLRITIPSDREFVAVEDLLPAGLEVVDLSLKTSSTLGPLQTPTSRAAAAAGDRANQGLSRYGTWYDGWWSPWEHQEIRDDRVVYFARALEKGSYTATYVARATTAGRFVRPPAHAEEMYNQSLGGRSDGGIFTVIPK